MTNVAAIRRRVHRNGDYAQPACSAFYDRGPLERESRIVEKSLFRISGERFGGIRQVLGRMIGNSLLRILDERFGWRYEGIREILR